MVHVEELAPDMRHARDLADGTGGDEALEAGVTVGMHPAGEARQMLYGMMGLAVGGEPVPGRRRSLSCPGTLVTHARLGAPGRVLARSRGQHLDRCVIGENCPTGEHVPTDRIGQRYEQYRRLAQPASVERSSSTPSRA